MNGDWYYATDGAPVGPVTFDALLQLVQRGQVKRDHLVWTNSMAGWEPASSVTELWPSPPSAPSRPPAMPVAPQTRAKAAAAPAPRYADNGGFSQNRVRHAEATGNWIVRHWRGDLPLWKSFWLVGLLLGLGVGLLVGVIFFFAATVASLRAYVLAIVATAVIAWWAIVVWQLTGIWRAAGNHIVRTNGEWRRFWAVLARIVVVLSWLQLFVTAGFRVLRHLAQ